METNNFSGSPADMGMQQGNAFKVALHDGFEKFKRLELVKSLKTRLMPAAMFLWLAGSNAKNKLEPVFKTHAPRQRERIKGIAAGSGIDERFAWLFTSMEVVIGINDDVAVINWGFRDIDEVIAILARPHWQRKET